MHHGFRDRHGNRREHFLGIIVSFHFAGDRLDGGDVSVPMSVKLGDACEATPGDVITQITTRTHADQPVAVRAVEHARERARARHFQREVLRRVQRVKTGRERVEKSAYDRRGFREAVREFIRRVAERVQVTLRANQTLAVRRRQNQLTGVVEYVLEHERQEIVKEVRYTSTGVPRMVALHLFRDVIE